MTTITLNTTRHSEHSTMARMPSGNKKRLYNESTVSLMSTSQDRCNKIGPVSSPSSAQNIEKPALTSPSSKVLKFTFRYFIQVNC